MPNQALAGVDGDPLPISLAGAGQDRVSTVLSPWAISDAQGWCSVMAYTGSTLMGPVIPGRRHYPRRGRHRSDAGPDLGDDAGGHAGPDDVVAAVVLAADAVQALDIDGVGCADRQLQFGAAAGDKLH